MIIGQLTDYEQSQLDAEQSAAYKRAHAEVDAMLKRTPSVGACDGPGVTMDELFGDDDA